jgi:hypothetical protein
MDETPDMCFLQSKYDGISNTHEVCAVLGLSLKEA